MTPLSDLLQNGASHAWLFVPSAILLGALHGLEPGHSKTMRIDFVELPCAAIAPARAFYADAFGLAFTDFGPTYASTLTGDVDVGLQADPPERTAAPLPVIRVDNLEAALRAVEAAAGTITRPIFAFPGGRRFHFRDPAGNELAGWVTVAE